jgi:PAS domain S-box-containing protein
MGPPLVILTRQQALADDLTRRLDELGFGTPASLSWQANSQASETAIQLVRQAQPQVTLLAWPLRSLAEQLRAVSTTGILYLLTAEDEGDAEPIDPVGPVGTLRLPCSDWDLETQVRILVYRHGRHWQNERTIEEARQRLEFEMLLSELSARFVNLSINEIDQVIEYSLKRIGETLGVERIHFARFSEDLAQLVVTHTYAFDGQAPVKGIDISSMAPWYASQMRSLQPVIIENVAQLTSEAKEEIMYASRQNLQSMIALPLVVSGRPFGVLSAAAQRRSHPWPPELAARLRLVGEIFAAALARKSSEDALRQSEERYRQLFEMTRLVKLVVDPRTGAIVHANRAAAEFYGYSLEELKRLRVIDLNILPEEQVRRDLRLAASQERSQFKFRHQLANGEVRDVEVYTGPLSLNGETFLLSVIIDVTERERLLTQERETQKRIELQERLASVGQLAAGIAHDFNNILSVIVLQAEVALSATDLSRNLRERLSTIVQQAGRASNLIQQVLDFSRRAVLERRPMDLLPLIKEQARLLERTLPENIRLHLSYLPGEYLVLADPTRLQQAVMNLAVNARDAMPVGGELHIRLTRLAPEDNLVCNTCGEIIRGEWLCLEVSDSGMGIPAEVQPHIFEPFYTTKAPGKGTGLGLAQVYGIVKQHQGHIRTFSQVGQGASFYIYLPALPAQETPPLAIGRETLILGHHQTVLLVEDDEVTRNALQDGLVLLNYRVVSAAGGDEALDYLQHHPGKVALVLSDVVMPGMGGIALMRRLRELGQKMPVVLISGHPLPEELEQLRQDGMSFWLPKPASLHQLSKVLVTVFNMKPE